MTLTLYNLKASSRLNKKKKRIGRGNSSGHGTYSTRGQKGQRSRSGGKGGLKLKGFMSTARRIPKLKGFRSIHPKPQIVNLVDLERKFSDGATVDKKGLIESGLIAGKSKHIKILGKGKLIKRLVVKANSFSESAKTAIEKSGGQAIKLAN